MTVWLVTGDWSTAVEAKDASEELIGTLALCDQALRKSGSGDDGVITSVNPFAKGDGKRVVAPISTILATTEDIQGARAQVRDAC